MVPNNLFGKAAILSSGKPMSSTLLFEKFAAKNVDEKVVRNILFGKAITTFFFAFPLS